MKTLRVKIVREGGRLPTRGYADDAGLDLYAAEDVWIEAHSVGIVPTGIAIEGIPSGYYGLVAPRGRTAKIGVAANGTIVDAGYRGELLVPIQNVTCKQRRIPKGDRFCQLVVTPVLLMEPMEFEGEFETTERGSKSFGSTG